MESEFQMSKKSEKSTIVVATYSLKSDISFRKLLFFPESFLDTYLNASNQPIFLKVLTDTLHLNMHLIRNLHAYLAWESFDHNDLKFPMIFMKNSFIIHW